MSSCIGTHVDVPVVKRVIRVPYTMPEEFLGNWMNKINWKEYNVIVLLKFMLHQGKRAHH